MIKNILASNYDLTNISSAAAEAYMRSTDQLLTQVANQLLAHPQSKALIGGNPQEVMKDLHQKHAISMATALKINSYELLEKTVLWMYRTYLARGFRSDYFSTELLAWQQAIKQSFDNPDHANELLAIYQWLLDHHQEMIEQSLAGADLPFAAQREANKLQQVFISLLLQGDTQGALKLADDFIKTAQDLKHFYLEVVWPSMVEVGKLWEADKVSVAEEHLATAIVGRVMAALYPRFAHYTVTRGKAIVSAGPNEFHEIGARMCADFLELDGWDVTYLGANTPADEILAILERTQPFLVALSIATVFNLEKAGDVIRSIKANPATSAIKVIVGGHSFSEMPQLWQMLHADAYAADAETALRIANDWWNARAR